MQIQSSAFCGKCGCALLLEMEFDATKCVECQKKLIIFGGRNGKKRPKYSGYELFKDGKL
jgi:hypothetical protein